MRARFYTALAAYEQDQVPTFSERAQRFFSTLWLQRPALQMGVAVMALLVGLVIGPRLVPAPAQAPGTDAAIESLRNDLSSMNRTVTLSLLEHQSASERLRGIEWSLKGAQDAAVVSALLNTVKYDGNVNVRLAAVDVLAGLAERPEVFTGLAEALPRQDSASMQLAVADVLMAVNPADSTSSVKQVLERADLDPTVRQRLQASLAGPI